MSGKPRSSAPRSSNGPRAGGAAAPAAAAAAGAASSSAAATPSKKSGADNAAERQASPDAAAAAATGAPVPAGDETRLLVDWHHVGAIIGKGGQSVKQIREESGCAINIIAPAPNAPSPQQIDRIMTIKGDVAQSTKAIYLIAHTIQARAAERKAAGQEPEQAQRGRGREPADGSTAIKLLVHRAAVGAVIGKAGDAIRQTQAETGARIQVSSEPLGHSTDKTVSISGTPEVVETATRRVLQQLAESPLRAGTKTVYYVPGPAYYDYNGQEVNGAPQQQGQQQQQVPHHAAHPNVGAGVVSGSGPISIQKIAIPTICAGCVIGRSGTIIRDLRSQSGTNISIADPDPLTPDERVVTITGSPAGIQTAVYLIRQCVESYVPPAQQQGGAQEDGAGQEQQAGGQEEQTQQEQTA